MRLFKHLRYLSPVTLSLTMFVVLSFTNTKSHATIVASTAEFWDVSGKFTPGSLRNFPIDTQYIEINMYTVLDSLGADSVVKLFPGYDEGDTLYTQSDGNQVKLIDLSRFYQVYFAGAVTWEEVETAVATQDSVTAVSPVNEYELDGVPNDSLFPLFAQWYLDSTDIAGTRAVRAWERTEGDSSQIIAILDEGVDGSHEDLINGRIIGGIDILNPAGQWNVDGVLGHGTAVTGFLAAKTNNDTGMAAINWKSKAYIIKNAISKPGPSIDHADSLGAQLINMSFGGFSQFVDPKTDGFPSTTACAAYNAWIKGISLIASKGNTTLNNTIYHTPSDYTTVIGVGAVNTAGDLLANSAYTNDIRVVAGGLFLKTTAKGGGYGDFAGTSGATPIVTGVLSLIRAADSAITADEAEELMYMTADDITLAPASPGYDEFTGYGAVDAGSAIEYIENHIFVRLAAEWNELTLVDSTPLSNVIFYNNFGGGLPDTSSAVFVGDATQFTAVETFDYSSYGFGHTPDVIMRRRGVRGWELSADSIQEISWARVVSGTATSSSVDVETGVYRANGGWWPCNTPNCDTATGHHEARLAITLAVTTTPGDVNNDKVVAIADPTALINWIFYPTSYPAPPILNDADANGSCHLNIGDATYLIAYIFTSGPAPVNADCVPTSLKLVPGDNFVITEDVAVAVGAAENTKRPVRLNTSRKLHALALTLRALNGSKLQVTNRLDGVQLHWSQQGEMVKIGLLDINGKRFITPADTNLIDIEGDFEIIAVEATDILADGTTEYMRPEFVAGKFTSGSDASIKEISLDGIHPNPFNPITSIAFSLPHSANVRIEIFNLLGQRVTTLVDRSFDAGSHKVQWDSKDNSGSKVASGIYFAKMISGDYTASKKMVILK